jgi:hypothetical protein
MEGRRFNHGELRVFQKGMRLEIASVEQMADGFSNVNEAVNINISFSHTGTNISSSQRLVSFQC